MIRKFALPAVCLMAMMMPRADAGLLVDISGGTPGACDADCAGAGTTIGYSITLTNSVTITGIGVWDSGSNGIGVSTQAGIWDAMGSLLTSAFVDDMSTPVASAEASGRWLFTSIPSLVLGPGTYFVGNLFIENGLLAQLGPAFGGAPLSALTQSGVSVGGSVLTDTFSTGFGAPLSFYTTGLAVGTTLMTEDLQISAAPEPGSVALVLAGLTAVGVRYRRKR